MKDGREICRLFYLWIFIFTCDKIIYIIDSKIGRKLISKKVFK